MVTAQWGSNKSDNGEKRNPFREVGQSTAQFTKDHQDANESA